MKRTNTAEDLCYSYISENEELSLNFSINPKRKSQFPGDIETFMKKEALEREIKISVDSNEWGNIKTNIQSPR